MTSVWNDWKDRELCRNGRQNSRKEILLRPDELPLCCESGYIASISQPRSAGHAASHESSGDEQISHPGASLLHTPTTEMFTMRNHALLFLFLFLIQATIGVAAETGVPAGKVKRSEGNVTVDRAGQVQMLKVGAPVYVGDRIRTAADGAVGITLSDDTLLTAGPRSTLLINEFQFNSTTHEGGMLATLLKGTLSVVTGLIGKQAPENVHFRTPTVLLGIRGTEFIVDARAEDE